MNIISIDVKDGVRPIQVAVANYQEGLRLLAFLEVTHRLFTFVDTVTYVEHEGGFLDGYWREETSMLDLFDYIKSVTP